MRRTSVAFVLLPFLWLGLHSPTHAKGGGSPGSSGHSGSSGGHSSSSSSGPKTVHVNGYVKNDGTVVQPYYRSAPRTAVREEPRLGYRVVPPMASDVPSTSRTTAPGTADSGQTPEANQKTAVGAPSVSSSGAGDDSDLREQAAALLLASAKKTEASGRKAKVEGRRADGAVQLAIAKQGYEDILAKYPETKSAAEARERLLALAKESGLSSKAGG